MQVFIDGLVQEVDTGDPMVRKDISRVNVETTKENFDEANKVYGRALKLKRLRSNADYQELIQDAEEQLNRCQEALLSYTGARRGDKIDRLNDEYRDRKIILNYLRNTVEEAALVPRPVFVPQEQ